MVALNANGTANGHSDQADTTDNRSDTAAAAVKKALKNLGSPKPKINGTDHARRESPAPTAQEVSQTLKRLWFVRIAPKPAEAAALKPLEAELDVYRAQYRLINETLSIRKMEREAARDEFRSARDILRRCKDECDAKYSEIEKLKDNTRIGVKVKDEFRDLPARSIAELNAKVAALQLKIEHESNPLGEEKKLMASLKHLESQRTKVQEYEARHTTAVTAASKPNHDRALTQLADLETQLSALRGEREIQASIVAKFKEKLDVLDEDVTVVMGDRNKVRDLQDAAYNKLQDLRQQQKDINSAYHANRRFSREVRDLLAAGKVEEAQQRCALQMDEEHAKLKSDPGYRKEYYESWEQYHESQAVLASSDEGSAPAAAAGAAGSVEADIKPPIKAALPKAVQAEMNGKGSTATPSAPAAAVEPALKAQKVIEAVLASAEAEIKAFHATEAAANAAAAHIHVPTANGGGPTGSKLDESTLPKPSKPPKHHHKKPQPAPEPDPIASLPVFELPDIVKVKPAASKAMDKAEERERNRTVQEEAERRKAKREEEKAKRRQKAASMSHRSVSGGAGGGGGGSGSVSGIGSGSHSRAGSQSAGSIDGDRGGMRTRGAADAAGGYGIGEGGGNKAGVAVRPVDKILAHKAVAKRPKTRGPLGKELKIWYKKNQDVAILGGAFFAMFLFWFFLLR